MYSKLLWSLLGRGYPNDDMREKTQNTCMQTDHIALSVAIFTRQLDHLRIDNGD